MWVGTALGSVDSEVVLTLKSGYLAGLARIGSQTYSIKPTATTHVVERIVPSRFPPCGVGRTPVLGAVPQANAAANRQIGSENNLPLNIREVARYGNLEPSDERSVSAGDTVVDLLSVYTPQARAAAGGHSQIQTEIQNAVDLANQGFKNSQNSPNGPVLAGFRLVHTQEIAYNDANNLTADLNWALSDAALSALRNQYGADMVSLIVNGGSSCGIAPVMRSVGLSFAPYAFQVTRRGCFNDLTFAHEHGHNLGMEHNFEDAGIARSSASYPWSFGHRVAGSFRTIMSYECPAGGSCMRQNYFSNPNVLFSGTPTGVANLAENARTASLTVPVVSAFRAESGLHFVPVPPCRVVDTRYANGDLGSPIISAGTYREFPFLSSSCGIPTQARAYSINATVVPSEPLAFLTIWPTGLAQPTNVSTLNSFDGRIKANATVVSSGGSGRINVYATNTTHVILDINGYFVPPGTHPNALAFYPVTPCRVLDTRYPNGPLGGPIMPDASSRSFPVRSTCGLPSSAQAYSLNATVAPTIALAFLTLWPTGQGQPLVSTLNAYQGGFVANAALVPAGTSGDVSAFVSNQSHLILDVNGYFAPPGSPGALQFYSVPPCRVSDTRYPTHPLGGPIMAAAQSRSWPVSTSLCGWPATPPSAYLLNATVIPQPDLAFLSLWASGTQPSVSTLNATGDPVVSNMAIVPASSGSIASFTSNQTHLVLDTSGYFAP